MALDFNTLKQLVITIRDEFRNRMNTALRVGTAMLEMVQKTEEGFALIATEKTDRKAADTAIIAGINEIKSDIGTVESDINAIESDINAIESDINILKRTTFKYLAPATDLDTVLTPGTYYIGTQEQNGLISMNPKKTFLLVAGQKPDPVPITPDGPTFERAPYNDITQYLIDESGKYRKHYTGNTTTPERWDQWTNIPDDLDAIKSDISILQQNSFIHLSSNTDPDTIQTPGAYYIGLVEKAGSGQIAPINHAKDFLFVVGEIGGLIATYSTNDVTQYKIEKGKLSFRKHWTRDTPVTIGQPSTPARWDEWATQTSDTDVTPLFTAGAGATTTSAKFTRSPDNDKIHFRFTVALVNELTPGTQTTAFNLDPDVRPSILQAGGAYESQSNAGDCNWFVTVSGNIQIKNSGSAPIAAGTLIIATGFYYLD